MRSPACIPKSTMRNNLLESGCISLTSNIWRSVAGSQEKNAHKEEVQSLQSPRLTRKRFWVTESITRINLRSSLAPNGIFLIPLLWGKHFDCNCNNLRAFGDSELSASCSEKGRDWVRQDLAFAIWHFSSIYAAKSYTLGLKKKNPLCLFVNLNRKNFLCKLL